MLERVPLLEKELDHYRDIVGTDVVDRIETLAKPLQGARVLHLNATAYGGGVAELLATHVPLLRSLDHCGAVGEQAPRRIDPVAEWPHDARRAARAADRGEQRVERALPTVGEREHAHVVEPGGPHAARHRGGRVRCGQGSSELVRSQGCDGHGR